MTKRTKRGKTAKDLEDGLVTCKPTDDPNGVAISLSQARKWRRQAAAYFRYAIERGNEDLDFADGEQWDKAAKRENEDNDKPSLVFHWIFIVLNAAIAIQRSQRQMPVAEPMHFEDVDIAEVVTEVLNYVSNQVDLPAKTSRTAEWAWKYGFGIRRQERNDLAIGDPMKITVKDPRRFLFDPWSRDDDWADARFLVEESIVAVDEAKRRYSWMADRFDGAAKNLDLTTRGGRFGDPDEDRDGKEDQNGPIIWPMEYWEDDEEPGVVNFYDGMVRLVEMEYAVVEDAVVLTWPDGYQEEIDPDDWNDVLKAYSAEQQGATRAVGPVRHIRRKIWWGKVEIADEPLGLSYQDWSYIPTWAYRDRKGGWAGMVTWLKDPQREINYRTSALLGIIGSQQVWLEEGAVEDIGEIEDQVNRPNAIILMKRGGLQRKEVTRFTDVAAIHDKMQDKTIGMMNQFTGMNEDVRGQQSNAESSVAIARRQQAGSLQLQPLLDQLVHSDKMLYERLLSESRALYTAQKQIRIANPDGSGSAFVIFNVSDPQVQQQLMQRAQAKGVTLKLAGSLADARVNLKMDDAPASPTEMERRAEALLQLATQVNDPVAHLQLTILGLKNLSLQGVDQVVGVLQQRIQQMMQPPQQQGPSEKLIENLNFKDLGGFSQAQGQLLQQAGLSPARDPQPIPQPAPRPALAAPRGAA